MAVTVTPTDFDQSILRARSVQRGSLEGGRSPKRWAAPFVMGRLCTSGGQRSPLIPERWHRTMAAVDEIMRNLPIDHLAQQVGASPQEVEQAAQTALPALLGGLQANAQDPGGASSIVEALGQHPGGVLDDGIDVSRVDTNDGQKIASHIFGSNEEQVYSALGGGAGGTLVKRLIPILAPIVLSYLSKKVLGGAAGGASAGQGGALESILKDVLGSAVGGATQQAPAPTQKSPGGAIIDILGGLLGGGRR